MTTRQMKALERAAKRLVDIHVERRRQLGYLGERLGVSARLRELERDERSVLRRIERLKASNIDEPARQD